VIAGPMMQLDTCHWKARVVGVASNMERLHMAVFMVRNQKDKINTSCLAHQTALSSCSSLHTAFEHLAQCPAYIRHAVWLLATGQVGQCPGPHASATLDWGSNHPSPLQSLFLPIFLFKLWRSSEEHPG
jgi:hypothetical protein